LEPESGWRNGSDSHVGRCLRDVRSLAKIMLLQSSEKGNRIRETTSKKPYPEKPNIENEIKTA
jgi:hypothetical protein